MEETYDTILKLDTVTKRFGSFTAVDEISFVVQPGTIVGLLGPNGAGKTTLLSMLVGFFSPSSGSITISGEVLAGATSSIKHTFGFVPDSQDVLNHLTGWEYLAFVRCIYRLSTEQWEKVHEYLSLLQMETKIHGLLGTYSHGQKKKLQLIAALLHQPELLILDEPFSGLDPEMVALTKQILRGLRKHDVGILLATHDLLMAEDLCDEILLLHQGKLLVQGSLPQLQQIYRAQTLEEIFLKALCLEDREKEVAHVLSGY